MSDAINNIDEMMKAAERDANIITQIATLAIEYEARSITAERFSSRVLDILHRASKNQQGKSNDTK